MFIIEVYSSHFTYELHFNVLLNNLIDPYIKCHVNWNIRHKILVHNCLLLIFAINNTFSVKRIKEKTGDCRDKWTEDYNNKKKMSFLLKNMIKGHKILAGHSSVSIKKTNIVLLKTKHLCSNAIINTCKTGINDTSALRDLKSLMKQKNGYQLWLRTSMNYRKHLPHRELNRNKMTTKNIKIYCIIKL